MTQAIAGTPQTASTLSPRVYSNRDSPRVSKHAESVMHMTSKMRELTPPICVMENAQIETAPTAGDRGRQQREVPRRSPVELLHEKVSWRGREVHSLFSSVGHGGSEQKKKAPTEVAGPSNAAPCAAILMS